MTWGPSQGHRGRQPGLSKLVRQSPPPIPSRGLPVTPDPSLPISHPPSHSWKPALTGTREASLDYSPQFACSEAMSVPAVDAVLEFMRKNGFLEAESVLTEELADKGDLGSFDFEKFIFPVLPPLPPLRIPARSEDAGACGGGAEGSCGSSSDDQFMSLGSYASDACSSSGPFANYFLQHFPPFCLLRSW